MIGTTTLTLQQINEINSPERKIPESHINKYCMPYKGSQTCRYLTASSQGFVCCKNTSLKPISDELVKRKISKAKGDNCEGI